MWTAVSGVPAVHLPCSVKKIGPKTLWPEEGLPPKLDKQHKQRSHAAACTAAMRAPLVDVPMPPIVAFATPIPFPAMNAPLVAASPLPMMPFGSVRWRSERSTLVFAFVFI